MALVDLDVLDERGWVVVPEVLSPAAAAELAIRCQDAMAALGSDRRIGDKVASGTRRLVDLADRVPEVLAVYDDPRVQEAVVAVLGHAGPPDGVVFRAPQPGFGEQKFHADAAPLVVPGPWQVATTILALCPFTPDNGATAVVPGSHRRPDLQRHSGNLDDHRDAVALTAPAGTAFVFCGHLLHRGTRNRSAAPRPALQANWRH